MPDESVWHGFARSQKPLLVPALVEPGSAMCKRCIIGYVDTAVA